MTIELTLLGCAVVLGLAHVFIAAGLATHQRGLRWNAGNRDGNQAALVGVAARADRASRNFLETFPFFAVAILGVVVAHTNTPHTVLGAKIYLWARLLYLPIYLVGIPYLRTLLWAVSLWGLLQVLYGLF